MDRDAAFRMWAGRLCLCIVSALCIFGLYYGNVRFLPIAAGFAIVAAVCYTEGRERFRRRVAARPSNPNHTRPSS